MSDDARDPVERLARSGVVVDGEARVTISGGGREAHRIREFLARNRVPFDVAGGGEGLVCDVDGASLQDPTVVEVGRALGLLQPPRLDVYDLVIVGGGPAGLAAAVYGASEGLTTLVVERFAPGGQAGSTSRIENYVGFPDGISGAELADRARAQAVRLGAEFLLLREVVDGAASDEGHGVELSDGATVAGRALVCATGVEWRRLDVPGLEDLVGRGVYYGAAAAEAPGLDGKHVHVVGGGNSAGQAAVFFADWAESVTLLVRGDGLASSTSSYLLEQIDDRANIDVRAGTEVRSVTGDDWLDRIGLTTPDGQEEVDAHALFVCIGGEPRTEWAEGALARDAAGYLLTGRDLDQDLLAQFDWRPARDPLPLETTAPGLFATGDVRHGSTKRVSTAVGEGATVVGLVHDHLGGMGSG